MAQFRLDHWDCSEFILLFFSILLYYALNKKSIYFLRYPNDTRAHQVSNQWMWGDALMVSVPTTSGGLGSVYLPRGEWYEFYRGSQRNSYGESAAVQVRRNETSLFVRGGNMVFKQDCAMTAVNSKNTFIDIIIALEEADNYTATGELYLDDHTKKSTEKKENYHRLVNFTVYRKENDVSLQYQM